MQFSQGYEFSRNSPKVEITCTHNKPYALVGSLNSFIYLLYFSALLPLASLHNISITVGNGKRKSLLITEPTYCANAPTRLLISLDCKTWYYSYNIYITIFFIKFVPFFCNFWVNPMIVAKCYDKNILIILKFCIY